MKSIGVKTLGFTPCCLTHACIPTLLPQHSPFFAEQLTAFQVWLTMGVENRNPPEQLPIVLQVSPGAGGPCPCQGCPCPCQGCLCISLPVPGVSLSLPAHAICLCLPCPLSLKLPTQWPSGTQIPWASPGEQELVVCSPDPCG